MKKAFKRLIILAAIIAFWLFKAENSQSVNTENTEISVETVQNNWND